MRLHCAWCDQWAIRQIAIEGQGFMPACADHPLYAPATEQELRDAICAGGARVAQLEAALRGRMAACACLGSGTLAVRNVDGDVIDGEACHPCEQARAALAASPDAAGRRWELMQKVCEAAREHMEYCGPGAALGAPSPLRDALARLDAEGKP